MKTKKIVKNSLIIIGIFKNLAIGYIIIMNCQRWRKWLARRSKRYSVWHVFKMLIKKSIAF